MKIKMTIFLLSIFSLILLFTFGCKNQKIAELMNEVGELEEQLAIQESIEEEIEKEAVQIELKISSAEEEIKGKNYEVAINMLEEVLEIDKSNDLANDLYSEAEELNNKYKGFENIINKINELYKDGDYPETYLQILDLINNPDFQVVMDESNINLVANLKKELEETYDGLDNIVDDETRKAIFTVTSGSLEEWSMAVTVDEKNFGVGRFDSVKNILGEDLYIFWFQAVPRDIIDGRWSSYVLVISERSNSEAPPVSKADIVFVCNENLVLTQTGESAIAGLKRKYEAKQAVITVRGSKFTIDKFGEIFEIEIISIEEIEGLIENLKLSITLKES